MCPCPRVVAHVGPAAARATEQAHAATPRPRRRRTMPAPTVMLVGSKLSCCTTLVASPTRSCRRVWLPYTCAGRGGAGCCPPRRPSGAGWLGALRVACAAPGAHCKQLVVIPGAVDQVSELPVLDGCPLAYHVGMKAARWAADSERERQHLMHTWPSPSWKSQCSLHRSPKTDEKRASPPTEGSSSCGGAMEGFSPSALDFHTHPPPQVADRLGECLSCVSSSRVPRTWRGARVCEV